MPTKPNSSTKTAGLRDRAEAELQEMGAKQELGPMMAELNRRTGARLRKERKNQKGKAGVSKSESDPQRLLHELQVHQIELELQNVELQDARNRMEVLLEKYTDLYDFSPAGYFSLDEQGRILELNLTGAALLGIERSRLVNARLPRLIAPSSQPDFRAFLQRVFSGTGRHVCEVQLPKGAGAVSWIGIHGVSAISVNGPMKWCRVAISDITSIKRAEEMLRRNEVLFSALVEQSPLGVYVVDGQLRLQQVNAKAMPIFKKIHPLVGGRFSEIIHRIWPRQVADQVLERFRHTLKTGAPFQSSDFAERRRDTGVREFYEWQVQRVTLPGGEFGVVCFFSNITERKQAEATQRRVEVLGASNRKLEHEIVRRRKVEKALKKSDQHQARLLRQSRQMQEHLRHLSHQILHAQEEERKRISRELHDVIAQSLVGINVHLAELTRGAAANPGGLRQKVARTQQLVQESVDIVHRFARELRPTALDDLGLIPTLHAFIKEFAKRTGVRAHLKAFAGIEQLSIAKRTVLYRVAHEALNNVASHAKAGQVEVSIQKLRDGICMKVKDDGKSFQVRRALHPRRNNRLGLLGMRERLEMVGGSFDVESAPGKGTTIKAWIPIADVRGGGRNHWCSPLKPNLESP
jgi:PAS domain S-box-containing protein